MTVELTALDTPDLNYRYAGAYCKLKSEIGGDVVYITDVVSRDNVPFFNVSTVNIELDEGEERPLISYGAARLVSFENLNFKLPKAGYYLVNFSKKSSFFVLLHYNKSRRYYKKGFRSESSVIGIYNPSRYPSHLVPDGLLARREMYMLYSYYLLNPLEDQQNIYCSAYNHQYIKHKAGGEKGDYIERLDDPMIFGMSSSGPSDMGVLPENIRNYLTRINHM